MRSCLIDDYGYIVFICQHLYSAFAGLTTFKPYDFRGALRLLRLLRLLGLSRGDIIKKVGNFDLFLPCF